MKKGEERSRVAIKLPKVQKLCPPPPNQEIVTFKPFVNSQLTIQRSIRIPGKQSPSLYQYLNNKINDPTPLYYLEPFSSRSMTNKHYYNLEKRLENLQEVFNLLQEINGQEKGEIKDEIKEILVYQKQLMERYQRYEEKLKKLIELEKQCKLITEKKVSQYMNSQTASKRSSKILNNEIPDLFLFEAQNIQIPEDDSIYSVQSTKKSEPEEFSLQQNVSRSKSSHKPKSLTKSYSLQNLIQQKEQQKTELEQKLESYKSRIEQVKKSQEKFRNNAKIIEQKKQDNLQQIEAIQKTKIKLNEENQKLCKQLETQKLINKNFKNQLSEVDFKKILITGPIQDLYLIKKSLNNQLQQLRGSIRVYCRIRPLKSTEKPMIYDLKSHDFIHIKKTLQEQKSENIKTDFKFVFDRIFDQKTSQEQVFSEISQLIQTAIDGVNVCIFAYGQTGSGKTFTMQGSGQKGQQFVGLIPRSTELIFAELQKYRQNGWQTGLDVSINEIYNDEAVNLLAKSEIKMTKPIFTPTKSIKQVEQLFAKAISNRSTAFTLSNADSSRSHLIFIIRIKSKSPENNQQKAQERQSQLILVDLAGSERVKESGVSNQRMKQAQHINSSLSQLGQVIRSLKTNKGKTNFRNSKLTYFLEPYLQKGSKCIMFVNISPAMSDESQSINSLKFASTARECRLQAD